MIYVILGKGYTKEKAIAEFKEENYPHNFYFATTNPVNDKPYMEKADEVWCMGDCEGKAVYTVAKLLNKDIWRMG